MRTPRARLSRAPEGPGSLTAQQLTDAERHAWAGAVAVAMIAAYRRFKERADDRRDPDADQQLTGPNAGGATDAEEPA